MGKKKRMIFMTKKRFFSFLVLLVAVVAFMLIPKEPDETETEKTQTTSSQSAETTGENEEQEEEKEPLGGLKIGASNLIVLLALGSILAVNKYKEIKAEQSEEKD